MDSVPPPALMTSRSRFSPFSVLTFRSWASSMNSAIGLRAFRAAA